MLRLVAGLALGALFAAVCAPSALADAEQDLAAKYAPVVRLVEQNEECGPGEPYQPMDVEKQVLVIWAATNGFTDDVAIEDIRRFEASLLKFVENSQPGLLADIAEKKSLTDEIKAGLKQVLEDFKDTWSKTSTDTDFAATPARAAAAQPTA